MSTGPLQHGVTAELEALKHRLTSRRPQDIPASEASAIASEISAIRLQLKRLEADRVWVQEVRRRASD